MKTQLLVSVLAAASAFAPLYAEDVQNAPLPGEYLQSALLVVDPASPRLQLDLTAGSTVTKSVLGLIDRDRDGKISEGEAESYAAMLARDLIVRFDGREVDLRFLGSTLPDRAGVSGVAPTLRLEYGIVHGVPVAGPHKLELKNVHLPAISRYQLQATVPGSDVIRIDGEVGRPVQGEGGVAFTYTPVAEAEPGSWIGTTLSILGVLAALAGAAFWWTRGKQRPLADFPLFHSRFWKDLWKRLQGERPVSARSFQLER